MHVLAIDPGPTQSAVIAWNGIAPHLMRIAPNEDLIALLRKWRGSADPLVIEKVVSYGMTVGAEVFETVYWSGRFAEAYGSADRLPRMDVKLHLCHNTRAKDGNIRQALIDRFGVPGTNKNPGVLHGVSSHLWAALALGVTYWDQKAYRQGTAA